MFTLYVISAIVAGLLILVSVFSGHGESGGSFTHELSHDVGHELTHDIAHGEHEISSSGNAHVSEHPSFWIPFFSLRFWIYFAAAFGTIGILLESLHIGGSFSIFWWALLGGGVTGLLVSGMFQLLRQGESNSDIGEQDLLGVEGMVLVSLTDKSPGKVRCKVKGEMIDVLAMNHTQGVIDEGEKVVIVNIEKDLAFVMLSSEVLGR